MIPRILISTGEPAGIGPDITIKAAQQNWNAELITVCDPNLLMDRAKKLKLPLTLAPFHPKNNPIQHQPGTLSIVPVELASTATPGKLNIQNASYVLKCLELATDYCLQHTAHALVTGPIQKSILNEANIPFTGHTEFLAEKCQAPEVIMLFVANNLKVALVTTHLPLADVTKAITKEKLTSIIRLLDSELKKRFHIQYPKIIICGLNPHAGEMGHLGREEIDIISPVIKKMNDEHINITGPLAADTIFTEKCINHCDVILAMYHDQALPVVKYLSFGNAVNVTLGLPIIRTSVDHGTALDVAGTHLADAGSMEAAIALAITLAHPKSKMQ